MSRIGTDHLTLVDIYKEISCLSISKTADYEIDLIYIVLFSNITPKGELKKAIVIEDIFLAQRIDPFCRQKLFGINQKRATIFAESEDDSLIV